MFVVRRSDQGAVNFYVSLFQNSKTGGIFQYKKEAAGKTDRPVGSVPTIEFEAPDASDTPNENDRHQNAVRSIS